MKILCIGDIFGQEGIEMVEKFINKKEGSFDLIVANGENSADGFGITPEIADRLFSLGVDVITTGNHIWDKKEIHSYLDSNDKIIRPHNYPTANPGKGYVRIEINGKSVLVINLQGTVFLPALESPFVVVEKILKENKADFIIIDFHAEATSEKMALAKYLDGRISIIFGTHTHVQTNDAQILNGGTGYCTDIGMTGSHNGVIGVEKELVIGKFLNSMPCRFKPASGNVFLHGISATLEDGKCREIELVKIKEE